MKFRTKDPIGDKRRRGSSLAYTMCIVTLASLSTVWFASTSLQHQRMNLRKRDMNRAFHAAEAGLRLVIHWSNDQTKYTLNTELFKCVTNENYFTENGFVTVPDGRLQAQYPNLFEEIQKGPLVITHDMLSQMNLGTLTARAGKWAKGEGDPDMATIEKIILTQPYPGDPNYPDGLNVYSVGVSNSGVSRTVAAYMTLWPNLNIPLGAGLISMANAGMGGNAQVHWGESWARGDVTRLPNQDSLGHLDESSSSTFDKWARYRAEGKLAGSGFALNSGTWTTEWTTGMTAADMATHALYNGQNVSGDIDQPGWFPTNAQPASPPLIKPDAPDAPTEQPGPDPSDGSHTNAFFQNEPAGSLPFPDFLHQRRSQMDFKTYNALKKYAIESGNYYHSTTDGSIIDQNGNVADFTKFQEGNQDPHLYFVDTIDGNPPAADGSNLGSIKLAGQSAGYHGLFYLCANVEITGAGNTKYGPPATKPDGSTDLNNNEYADLKRVFLNGAMFAAGSIKVGGNPVILGTIVSETGIIGGATMDIYYNIAHRNGLNFRGDDFPDRFTIQRLNTLAQLPDDLKNL